MEIHHILGEEARRRAALAAAELGRDPRIRLVYLYGSAADPERERVRDIDLAVLGEPELDFQELLRLRARLTEIAGEALDLVSLGRAPIVLAKQIADRGRCLFARSLADEAAFVTTARSRYWDFEPFLKEQSRIAEERSLARRARHEAGAGAAPR